MENREQVKYLCREGDELDQWDCEVNAAMPFKSARALEKALQFTLDYAASDPEMLLAQIRTLNPEEFRAGLRALRDAIAIGTQEARATWPEDLATWRERAMAEEAAA